MKLYEITDEFLGLDDIEDELIDIEVELNKLEIAFSEKAENIAKLVRSLEAQKDADGEMIEKGSTGYFCGVSRLDNLDERLDALLDGQIPVVKLNRLEAELDEERIGKLVLNEFMIAHENPAAGAMCKVIVRDKEQEPQIYVEDEQGHSGLMIATPQQSWAIKAGGEILPLQERAYQLVAREKYRGKYDVIVVGDKETEIISRTRRGKIYVDGSHNVYDFTLGASLKVRVSDKPLTVVGFDEERRMEYARTNKADPVVRGV